MPADQSTLAIAMGFDGQMLFLPLSLPLFGCHMKEDYDNGFELRLVGRLNLNGYLIALYMGDDNPVGIGPFIMCAVGSVLYIPWFYKRTLKKIKS